jgi:hypothetical protein
MFLPVLRGAQRQRAVPRPLPPMSALVVSLLVPLGPLLIPTPFAGAAAST